MTPEGKVKKKVKACLDRLGAYYVMPHGAGYGTAGIPDFVGYVCQSVFFGIECKANGNVPTALQEKQLRLIRDAGGLALVIDDQNVEQLEQMILEWKHAKEE